MAGETALIRFPGFTLIRGGKIALGPSRCCPPCVCGGCSGSAAGTLLVDIDGSAAFGNPLMVGGMGCGGDPACFCYGCALVGGTYSIALGTGSPTSCGWSGVFDAPGYQAVCNGDQSDNGTVATEISLIVSFDGANYWAQLNITFAAILYQWNKNLGATKPVCSELFPLTFGNAESAQQEFWDWAVINLGSGQVAEPCDLRFIDITVDLP